MNRKGNIQIKVNQ